VTSLQPAFRLNCTSTSLIASSMLLTCDSTSSACGWTRNSRSTLDHDQRLDDRQRVQPEVFNEPGVVGDPVDGDPGDAADRLLDPQPDEVGVHGGPHGLSVATGCV
jgi:hypothetical protein